jgi:hypothetical protein
LTRPETAVTGVYVVALQHVQALVHTALAGVEGTTGSPEVRWYTLPYAELYGVPDLAPFRRSATHDYTDQVGQMLIDENVISFYARHPNAGPEDLPLWSRLPYHHKPLPYSLTAVEVLKAIHGYRYQASIHAGFWESEAACFCDALADWAHHHLPGWDGAAWEIDHEVVERRARQEASA